MKQPWLAVFLSFLLPGAGEIYAGKRNRGIILTALWICLFSVGLSCTLIFLSTGSDQTARQFLSIAAATWFLTPLLLLFSLIDSYKAANAFNTANGTPLIATVKKSWLAVFLSTLLPGIGQFYNLQILKGISFIIATVVLALIAKIHYSLEVLLFPLYFFALKDAFESSEIINRSSRTFLKTEGNLVRAFIILMIAIEVIPFGDIVKTHIIQAYKIPAASMLPTLEIGDHILVNKTSWGKASNKRGEIVVFKYPEDPQRNFIKRIVAIGGDTIEIRNKVVYVNGSSLSEPYIQHTDPLIKQVRTDPRDNVGPYTVPQNKFFVMGDNRDQSYDSRYWGYVPDEYIIGKALKIYWSWDTKNTKVRWDRIGKGIHTAKER